MTQIKEALAELNPWWKEEFNVEYKPRKIYSQIQKFMRQPQVLALTGLRRVGKTTLMLKIVEDAISRKFNPRRIVYFSFDEFRECDLRKVLAEYEQLTGADLSNGKHIVLFDEIQKLEGWNDQLKALYDLGKGRVKIVISGSEALFLRRGSRETLAGRMFEFKVEPLSFGEYLAFTGVESKPVDLHARELSRAFDEFLPTQGFPELVGTRDSIVFRKYLRESIVEKVLFRDLPTLVGVRDAPLLESLLNVLMEEPGQLVDLAELAGEMGVSRQTLAGYLRYLEESFLLRKLYNYSTGKRKSERKLKKYYPTIVSPSLLSRSDDRSRERAFEWIVVAQLRGEFFWRDPYKNEVDLILTNGRVKPVEIKHGKTDARGLLAFMNKFKIPTGHMITQNEEWTRRKSGKTIHAVPAFKFLLEHD